MEWKRGLGGNKREEIAAIFGGYAKQNQRGFWSTGVMVLGDPCGDLLGLETTNRVYPQSHLLMQLHATGLLYEKIKVRCNEITINRSKIILIL